MRYLVLIAYFCSMTFASDNFSLYDLTDYNSNTTSEIFAIHSSFSGSLVVIYSDRTRMITWISTDVDNKVSGKSKKVSENEEIVFRNAVTKLTSMPKATDRTAVMDGYSIVYKKGDVIINSSNPDNPDVIKALKDICDLTERKYIYSENDGKITFYPGRMPK